jgi:hypothetical protein
MPLPSSGPIKMSDLNTTEGFSSNQANSSLAQRTFDYAFSGVDQNDPYSFSEFYSKSYYTGSINTITLYYYYPWDGGSSPNNNIIWGWASQSSAELHNGLYQSWSHTCYYTGTLGNGTDIYSDPNYTGGTYWPLVDAGWYDIYPGIGSGSWYYLTDGTNSWTCQSYYEDINEPWLTDHTFQIKNLTLIPPPQYRIDWSFTSDATSADFEILVNGTQVVYVTNTNSGYFMIDPGDYIQVNTSCTATHPLAVNAYLYVYDSVDGVLYDDTNGGGSFAANTYGPYTPSGDGNISGDAHEY